MNNNEFRIFTFLNSLPQHFKIFFYIGLIVYAIKHAVLFFIPIFQRKFIDFAIETKTLISNESRSLLFLMLMATILLLLEYVGFRRLRIKLREYLYKESISKVMILPSSIIQSKGSAYYNSILTNLTQSLSTLISPSIFDFFFGTVQMLFINFLIFKWCRPVFYLFFVSYIFILLNTYLFHTFRKRKMNDISNSTALLSAQSNEIVANTFTLRTTLSSNTFINPLWDILKNNNNQMNSLFRALEINRFLFSLLKYCAFFIMLIIILKKIIRNEMSYGQLLAIISYFESLFFPFHNYVTFLGDLTNYGAWVKRYEDAFPVSKDYYNTNKKVIINKISDVELRDVLIPYNNKNFPISFKIDSHIGITGISGEGKTSILKILYKEIFPEKGDIIINFETTSREIPESAYYSAFNIMPQNIGIFNCDLSDNILLGKQLLCEDKVYYEKNKIYGYLKKINLKQTLSGGIISLPFFMHSYLLKYGINKDFSAFLPDDITAIEHYITSNLEQETNYAFNSCYILKTDYDNIIQLLNLKKLSGRKFGIAGEYISGGEKQRIALARFLLRKNYDFYIMDEPFTSLDADTEQSLIPIVRDHIDGHNGLLISHQFSNLEKLSKKIIFIENGNIAEYDTPENLILKKGKYFHLRKTFYENNQEQ